MIKLYLLLLNNWLMLDLLQVHNIRLYYRFYKICVRMIRLLLGRELLNLYPSLFRNIQIIKYIILLSLWYLSIYYIDYQTSFKLIKLHLPSLSNPFNLQCLFTCRPKQIKTPPVNTSYNIIENSQIFQMNKCYYFKE